MSAIQTLGQIFIEPGKAMDSVREKSMIWLPLLLLVLGSAVIQVWYYQVVDFPWLQDQMLSANPDMGPEQREAAKGFMSHGMMTIMAAVGTLVVIPIILLISAVYYLLAAKVIGNDLGFGKWFAFVVWTSVPSLLLLPAMAIQILTMSNGQLSPEALNPLSFNQLFFSLPNANPWAGLLNALNVASIWTTVVAVIGYRRWTDRGLGASTFIVLLPQIVIFGLWAAFAATRTAA